jgi:sigma-B regulation protein RsbU (phosphoserine phosphatase)
MEPEIVFNNSDSPYNLSSVVNHGVRVLVAVRDHQARSMLTKRLVDWGFSLVTAPNGPSALETCKQEKVRMAVVSLDLDGIDGLTLCRTIRETRPDNYIYTIALVPRDKPDLLIHAVEHGADKVLLTPFTYKQMEERLFSAVRLLHAEADLAARNDELVRMNDKLSRAQEVITRDLEAAARIQQGLLPVRAENLFGFSFDSLFIPCNVVGGDMFNFFPLDADHLAFYILDVSGHGIPAAMLSVAVSKTISSLPYHESMIRGFADDLPRHEMTSPASVVRELDQLFQANELMEKYFTMIYGVINRHDGMICFTQAGHPHPVYQPFGDKPRLIGSGGLPVGLLHDAQFSESCQQLLRHDRLFLYSDGIIECQNPSGETFGAERLLVLLAKYRDLPLNMLMRKIGEALYQFKGSDDFADDMSLMVIQRETG